MLDNLSCPFTSILDVNEHGRLTNITLRQTQIKVKEQLVVRTNIDVNGHERLSNINVG
jgi:hypothetical protein